MTALTKDRNTASRAGVDFVDSLAEGATIYTGALVCLEYGQATPGRTATGLRARGVAQETVVQGALPYVKTRKGIFSFENDAADPVYGEDVESTVYITDDQTISATDGTGTKSAAGKLVALIDGVPWVQIG